MSRVCIDVTCIVMSRVCQVVFTNVLFRRLTSISSDTFEYEGEDIVVLYAASGKILKIC